MQVKMTFELEEKYNCGLELPLEKNITSVWLRSSSLLICQLGRKVKCLYSSNLPPKNGSTVTSHQCFVADVREQRLCWEQAQSRTALKALRPSQLPWRNCRAMAGLRAQHQRTVPLVSSFVSLGTLRILGGDR